MTIDEILEMEMKEQEESPDFIDVDIKDSTGIVATVNRHKSSVSRAHFHNDDYVGGHVHYAPYGVRMDMREIQKEMHCGIDDET